MKYITLDTPESYDQIEAIGAFYKAVFNLADAYGLKDRTGLISAVKSSVQNNLRYKLEKQNHQKSTTPRIEDLDVEHPDDLALPKAIIDDNIDRLPREELDLNDVPF